METVKIVFWSQGGNTAAMAAAVAEGVQEAGSKAEIINVSDASVADLQSMKGFALGCPAMGAEVLEEMEMEPFMCELEGSLAGKSVGLFGSYGWGDGQWMRDWEERCKAAGAAVVGGEGVICQETPDDGAIASCRALGRALAAL
ncbi:MAG: flavodoxin [Suilimivivens sp.]